MRHLAYFGLDVLPHWILRAAVWRVVWHVPLGLLLVLVLGAVFLLLHRRTSRRSRR